MEDSGWRECKMCGKRLHCGCIASKYSFEYLDFGGVVYKLCKASGWSFQETNADPIYGKDGCRSLNMSLNVENGVDKNNFEKGRLPTVNKIMVISEPSQPFQSKKDVSLGKTKQGKVPPTGDVSICISNLNQQSIASLFCEPDNSRQNHGAYFPAINQSDGIPIRIQVIKGKEWIFQFKFWPNNNSRMYVLEGVTPCIQNMQLQAGDTVTFSRIDPRGNLVMGFRKATNNVETQRLLMHADDAMDLRITWDESQELLRPTPTSQPNIVVIEHCEFEESMM
ncbi:hypothetical protein RND71_009744 [Anisodus tanguticus]|uniref:TF-B3 domain-containing protein n=1 Tax=Anisodus tanguticus TaxID=243964 RepID=A0AAE1VRI2_9SOLA|nr:hypothetical protein RND71_009744 [Anisodus tanguticus]